MTPLNLLVHADSPETAARIERALRAGAPSCTVQFVASAPALVDALVQKNAVGAVAALPEPAAGNSEAPAAPTMSPVLRHELNNHLALIRMLADLLADDKSLPAATAAKAREIGTAAEAAAQAVRRTKTPVT